ncbi:SET domain-containing protein SmydA-8-like [Contarinia nasturtii]|uniref:SET domain-containing protein SmydA-8-like n=1 Tax=Contarinia nasturtii TaxID=265458 RepID=UPI0012D37323|nr:SET domain-containing protein SmydA-8-like [Contarinia nasturtii]
MADEKLWKTVPFYPNTLVDLFQNDIGDRIEERVKKIRSCLSKKRYTPFSNLFEQNQNFPDLHYNLSITQNQTYGRFVQATGNINAGEKIGEAKAFAAVLDKTDMPYCLTCFVTKTSKFPICCARCKAVYCSKDCAEMNKTHKYECATIIQTIKFGPNIDAKCAMQMLFKSLAIFKENVGMMCEAVKGMLSAPHNNNNAIQTTCPVQVNNGRSRFVAIMRLEGETYPGFESHLILAIHILQKCEKIVELFHYYPHFLQHLLGHFLKAINQNSFMVPVPDGEDRTVIRMLIFDTFSYFNHACSPNALHFIEGNRMTLISSCPISTQQEVNICYKECGAENDTNQRRQLLKSEWGFDCNCTRCMYGHQYGKEITQNDIDCVPPFLDVCKKKLQNYAGSFWDTWKGALIIKYNNLLAERADV